MLFAALGVVAIALGGGTGTFASFNAEVANEGNFFQTGTLFLHDTANGGNTCTSESATDNANIGTGDNCDYIFRISPTDAGASAPSYYRVALNNAGSIDASKLEFYANNACQSVAQSLNDGSVDGTQASSTTITVHNILYGIPANTSINVGTQTVNTTQAVSPGATQIHVDSAIAVTDGDVISYSPVFSGAGDGDLCSKLQFAIWEMPDGTDVDPGDGTCIYASGCTWTGNTLDTIPSAASNTGNSLLQGGGLSHGATRYLLIGINPPANLDNSYQNRKATVDIAWHIEQS
jgi:hypothetical protein